MSSSPLRAERRSQGLTIRQLADKAGVGEATVKRAEHGSHQPHRGTRRLIAAALGVDVAQVFPHDSDATPARHLNVHGRAASRPPAGGTVSDPAAA